MRVFGLLGIEEAREERGDLPRKKKIYHVLKRKRVGSDGERIAEPGIDDGV